MILIMIIIRNNNIKYNDNILNQYKSIIIIS